MGVKHSTDYADEAFAHVQALTDAGNYDSISDAVSAIVLRDKEAQDRDRIALETEVLRRIALSDDRWVPVRAEGFLDEAVARLDARINGSKG